MNQNNTKISFKDKFILFIKENYKFLIFLVFLYLFMTIELPYVVYTPGGSINMSKRVEGTNVYKEEGSISMTYVSMVRGSAPFLLLSYVIPNWDIVSTDNITYDGDDLDETVKIDKIYMKEAISNAEYVAYTSAPIEFTIKEEHNIVTVIAEESNTKMKSGDEILSIDNQVFKTLKEVQEYISTKKVGDTVSIKYKSNNKEKEEKIALIDGGNDSPKVGISMAIISEYETPYNISVKTKTSESGPSGGLMTALEIYNKITKEDITKGLKIMGTGTIDKDGTVGEIGGVKYKLIGAVKEGADVFICPEDNYKEAQKVMKENKYDITLISAKTFNEVLTKLKNIKFL